MRAEVGQGGEITPLRARLSERIVAGSPRSGK
jgi:hypothetical protein